MATPTAPSPGSLRDVIRTTIRLLTLRCSEGELASLGMRHFIFGLVCTWVAGVGRYWDNPRVGLLQHLGIGSVVYIFALSLLLWLVVWPLSPKHWTYFRVLAFLSLVSPPAILYAIPVERFFSLETSNNINFWFLSIVAVWRVVLLFFFLGVMARLDVVSVFVSAFLPLTLIVVALSALNLEKAVFSLMGGFNERTPNDAAIATLQVLSLASMLLFVPLLLLYCAVIIQKRFLKGSHGQSA